MKIKIWTLVALAPKIAVLVTGFTSFSSLSQTRSPIFSNLGNSNRIRLDFSRYPYQIAPRSNSVGYPVGSAICKVFLVPELAAQNGQWIRRSAPRHAGQRAAALCNATSADLKDFHIANMFSNQPDDSRCLEHGKMVASTCRSSAVVVYQTTASDKKRWILTSAADGQISASAPTRLNVSEVPRQSALGRRRTLEDAISNLEQSRATYIRMQSGQQTPSSPLTPTAGYPASSTPTVPVAQPQVGVPAPSRPTFPSAPLVPTIPMVPITQPALPPMVLPSAPAPAPAPAPTPTPAATAPANAPAAAPAPFVCQPGLIHPITKQPCPLVAAPSVPTPPRSLPSPGRGGSRSTD